MSYAGILEILQFLWMRYRREKGEDPLGKMELVTVNIHKDKRKKQNVAMEVSNVLQLRR